jgi:hypothetical protein
MEQQAREFQMDCLACVAFFDGSRFHQITRHLVWQDSDSWFVEITLKISVSLPPFPMYQATMKTALAGSRDFLEGVWEVSSMGFA